MNHANHLAVAAVAAAGALAAPSAGASEDAAVPGPRSAVAATAPIARAPLSALGAPLSNDKLAARRGADGSVGEMQLRGVVSDNRAVNVTTGANVISDGAFSGMAGVPMLVQNSGNNVLIQNATIINVQVK